MQVMSKAWGTEGALGNGFGSKVKKLLGTDAEKKKTSAHYMEHFPLFFFLQRFP